MFGGLMSPKVPHLTYCKKNFSSKPTKDYYRLLGITQEATSKEIKAAYFEAAKSHHPDSNSYKKIEGKFHDIQEAYKVLSDLSKRREYDMFRRSHVRPDTFDRMYGKRRRDFHRAPAGSGPGHYQYPFAEKEYTTPTTSIEKTVFIYAFVVALVGLVLVTRKIYFSISSDDDE